MGALAAGGAAGGVPGGGLGGSPGMAAAERPAGGDGEGKLPVRSAKAAGEGGAGKPGGGLGGGAADLKSRAAEGLEAVWAAGRGG